MSDLGRCEVCGRAKLGAGADEVSLAGLCCAPGGGSCQARGRARRKKLEALAAAVGVWAEEYFPENVQAAYRALDEEGE